MRKGSYSENELGIIDTRPASLLTLLEIIIVARFSNGQQEDGRTLRALWRHVLLAVTVKRVSLLEREVDESCQSELTLSISRKPSRCNFASSANLGSEG